MSQKRDSEYWKKRFEELERAQHDKARVCYEDVEKMYRRAQNEIEKEIAKWHCRFARNNMISLADARQMLTGRELEELRWDINEYIAHGEENAVSGAWIKQLENASARYHVSRLEALKLQTQQQMEVLFGNQLDRIDTAMKDIYTSGYYKTAFELQKGIGVGWDFASLDNKTISKVISKPWAVDGKNFSERIWNNRSRLVDEMHKTLTQNIMLGQDPQKAIKAISERMKVSKVNAGRLVMTEEAFFSSAAQKECFAELGVEQFEIVATLDSHTSQLCRDMDGKHFPMSEYKIGVTAPPFHVNCRSTTCPYFDDEFADLGERAARGADGKTYFVPANMTYREWEKAFVNDDKSALQVVKKDVENTFSNDIIELTEEDRHILNQYISFDFYPINDKLRNGNLLTEIEYSMVKQLDAALKKMPRYVGNLSRSLYFGDESALKECLKRFQIDKEICFRGFVSTTCGKELYNPEGEIQIYVENSTKGRSLTAINKTEMEVIYERGQSFMVKNIIFKNGIYWILLEEK